MAGGREIPREIVTATEKMQNSAFPEMSRVFREDRFHFPKELKVFESNSRLHLPGGPGGEIFFRGRHQSKRHDDTVYPAVMRSGVYGRRFLPHMSWEISSASINPCAVILAT